MISEREIWACAVAVMRRYGEGANVHAGRRADELLASGDGDGHRTWIRILERINELEKIEPDEDDEIQ